MRVVEGWRWSYAAIQRITGTHAKPDPSKNQAYQSIEETMNPHVGKDDEIGKAKMCDPQVP